MRLLTNSVHHSLAIIACALLLCGAALQSRFTPVGIQQGYLAGDPSTTPSAVALAHACGEFRIVTANVLWLNVVDHYHHQYMAQGHSWSTDVELLPMLNIITNLDPHFTEAYEVSSAILMHMHRMREASRELGKGSLNNPTDWALPYDTSMMYAWYLKDPRAALPYAERAEQLATDPFYKRMVGRLIHTLQRECAATAQTLSATRTRRSGVHARQSICRPA